MPSDYFHVDAFTDRPFAGNPAAVCVLEEDRAEEWMQGMAADMNLSETAFLRRRRDGDTEAASAWEIRWFTPTVEVDLCGHATLASAHVLWESGRVPGDRTICFSSRSGPLLAIRTGQWIELDFPARGVVAAEAPDGLVEGLGVMPLGVYRSEENDLLVEVADGAALRGIDPDFALLGALDARGVIVTCPSDEPGIHFLSRFFAPACGVPEDPVTGSAHCCLGPFWGRRSKRDELVGFQASARGGTVRIRLAADRVLLGGRAVTLVEGRLAPAALELGAVRIHASS